MSAAMKMFQCEHRFHLAEFNRLITQPRLARRQAALRELFARGEQLRRELARWMEMEAA